jgi:holin-like protein
MVLLSIVFASHGGADAASARLFDISSPHFTLFFVPAAVGIAASGDLLAQAWLPIAVAVVLGTAATIAVTGMLAQHLLRVLDRRGRHDRLDLHPSEPSAVWYLRDRRGL